MSNLALTCPVLEYRRVIPIRSGKPSGHRMSCTCPLRVALELTLKPQPHLVVVPGGRA